MSGGEDAKQFIKQLFEQGLISTAELETTGITREYMMFGQLQKETQKQRILLTTTDDRVDKLVSFINENSPNPYEYPVRELEVVPISDGNSEYMAQLKKQDAKMKIE